MGQKLKRWFQWNAHSSTLNACVHQNAHISLKMHAIYFEMYKTADFYSNLLVSWKLVTEGYQGRPIKCALFERPLPGIVILWLLHVLMKFSKLWI